MESRKVVSSSRKKIFGSSKSLLLFCSIELQKVVKLIKNNSNVQVRYLFKKLQIYSVWRGEWVGGRYGIRFAAPIFD